jgi:hypothetical protein
MLNFEKSIMSLVLGMVLVSSFAFAHEPKVTTVVTEKNRAVELFLNDEKVKAAIQVLEKDGYKQLSVESIPYQFFYTDEGPASLYLVSAYLGKSEQYGWSAKFVTARVDTDNWGQKGATVINSEEFSKIVNKLK